MDALITKAELAERIRIPEATLSFWRHKGKGPKGVRIGSRVLYRQSDVEQWIAEQFDAKESA